MLQPVEKLRVTWRNSCSLTIILPLFNTIILGTIILPPGPQARRVTHLVEQFESCFGYDILLYHGVVGCDELIDLQIIFV